MGGRNTRELTGTSSVTPRSLRRLHWMLIPGPVQIHPALGVLDVGEST